MTWHNPGRNQTGRLHTKPFSTAALLTALAALTFPPALTTNTFAQDAHDHSSHDYAEHDHGTETDDHSHADTEHAHDEAEHTHSETDPTHESEHTPDDGHNHEGTPIAINKTVEQNLGITYAKAEARRVEQTLRVPGHFELKPSAMHDAHTPVSGRLHLLVDQYDSVQRGQRLAEIDSPDWRRLQAELTEAIAAEQTALANVDLAVAKRQQQAQRVELLQQRVVSLQEAQVRRIELENQLAEARLALPALQAEEQAARVQAQEASAHIKALFLQAAATTNLPIQTLQSPPPQPPEGLTRGEGEVLGLGAHGGVGEHRHSHDEAVDHEHDHGHEHIDNDATPGHDEDSHLATHGHRLSDHPTSGDGSPAPLWQTLDRVPITAENTGQILSIAATDGQWLQVGDELMQVIEPNQLRFRGEALVADLARLQPGLPVSIAPFQGGGWSPNDQAHAKLTVGPVADPTDRSLALYANIDQAPRWARPGLPALMDITLDPTAKPVVAVPQSALVQDGLSFVLFKKDNDHPGQLLRIEAETGPSDGRWIQILDGINPGDEVVLEGVQQLLAATSNTKQQGGHFHPDGSFHEGEDE